MRALPAARLPSPPAHSALMTAGLAAALPFSLPFPALPAAALGSSSFFRDGLSLSLAAVCCASCSSSACAEAQSRQHTTSAAGDCAPTTPPVCAHNAACAPQLLRALCQYALRQPGRQTGTATGKEILATASQAAVRPHLPPLLVGLAADAHGVRLEDLRIQGMEGRRERSRRIPCQDSSKELQRQRADRRAAAHLAAARLLEFGALAAAPGAWEANFAVPAARGGAGSALEGLGIGENDCLPPSVWTPVWWHNARHPTLQDLPGRETDLSQRILFKNRSKQCAW